MTLISPTRRVSFCAERKRQSGGGGDKSKQNGQDTYEEVMTS